MTYDLRHMNGAIAALCRLVAEKLRSESREEREEMAADLVATAERLTARPQEGRE